MVAIQSQFHGYSGGHQLLSSTLKLDKIDQDTIDRLSDIAGPLRPGEIFKPYLTTYPLPSGKYYVFALTNQDLEAPRAGCVKTKSLIIPIEFWKAYESPASFLSLLEKDFQETSTYHSEELIYKALPAIDFSELNELAEVLFLEKRSSVVMFDAAEVQSTALRLLTALWPGMRAQFCVCTFALSPRYIQNKPFDLIFSVKHARSRFAEWPGRKIDPTNKIVLDRHRWTKHIVESIFSHNPPELLDSDTRFNLSLENENSEAALRLSLMWSELEDKAEDGVPTAVLGMLDIVNSRDTLNQTWPKLKKLIINSLDRFSPNDMKSQWTLIEALLLKLKPNYVDQDIEISLTRLVRKLAEFSWESSLQFLLSSGINKNIPTSLYETVSNTLIEIKPFSLGENLFKLSTKDLKKLIVIDIDFLDILFEANFEINSKGSYREKLTDLITEIPPNDRFYLLKAYLHYFKDKSDLKLLEEILKEVFPYQFIEAVSDIWIKNKVRSWDIGLFFSKKSQQLGASKELLNLLSTIDPDENTLHCIKMLLIDPKDISWVLNSPHLDATKAILIDTLINKFEFDQIRIAFNSEQLMTKSISILAKGQVKYFKSLSKLITLVESPKQTHVDIGITIFSELSTGKEFERLKVWLLNNLSMLLLSKSNKRSSVLLVLLSETSDELVCRSLFSTNLSGDEVSKNLILITNNDQLKIALLRNIERIIEQLINRSKFDFTMEGINALIGLLGEVKDKSNYKYLSLCASLLPFAMSGRDGFASELLKEIFPPVYNELAKSNDLIDLMRSFVFEDWDKCKTARKDLVRAFIYSNWPPIDLVLIAIECKDTERIIHRIMKEPQGKAYLKNISSHLDQLDTKSMRAIQKYF